MNAARPGSLDSKERQGVLPYVRGAYMLGAHEGVPLPQRPEPIRFLPLRPVEFQVLLSLAQGERHGYGIMQEALSLSDGETVLEPGTLYRALRRMLQAGLVLESARRPDVERPDERRRYYRLTELGRRVAAAEAARLQRLVAAARAQKLLGGKA
jgi:DNA-binding PadR family transcriptional regulator